MSNIFDNFAIEIFNQDVFTVDGVLSPSTVIISGIFDINPTINEFGEVSKNDENYTFTILRNDIQKLENQTHITINNTEYRIVDYASTDDYSLIEITLTRS